MDQFQVLMMQALVLAVQGMAGSAAEAMRRQRGRYCSWGLLWDSPSVLLCNALPAMWYFLPLAYLLEIYFAYMFLNLEKIKNSPLEPLFRCLMSQFSSVIL